MLEFGKCPKCQEAEIKNGTNTYTCVNSNCDFFLFKEFNGYLIEPEILEEIINAEEQGVTIDKLKTKEGEIYSSTVYYNKEANKLYTRFEEQVANDLECPACQGKIMITPKSYACENASNKVPEEQRCNIIVWKNKADKKLSEKTISQLLKGEKTDWISGFSSKTGKKFGAYLYLSDSTFNVEFDFSLAKCPKCQNGDITENDKAYSCSNWKSGCKFTVWKSQFNYNVTAKDVLEIVENGGTGIRTLKDKDKKEYQGKLYYNKELDKMEVI